MLPKRPSITDERELAAVEEHLLLCDRRRSEEILVDNLRAALEEKAGNAHLTGRSVLSHAEP